MPRTVASPRHTSPGEVGRRLLHRDGAAVARVANAARCHAAAAGVSWAADGGAVTREEGGAGGRNLRCDPKTCRFSVGL